MKLSVNKAWRLATRIGLGAAAISASAVGFVATATPASACGLCSGPGIPVAYVALQGPGQLQEISLVNDAVVKTVSGLPGIHNVVVTPDGKTAFVTEINSGVVVPVNLTTMTVEPAIKVGTSTSVLVALAMTPNGSTVYVADRSAGKVTPIDVATGKAGSPIVFPAGSGPDALAINPAGTVMYVAEFSGPDHIVPVSIPSGVLQTPISQPDTEIDGLSLAPDGATLYAASFADGAVVPISTATKTAASPIDVGGAGAGTEDMAITPDGTEGYAIDYQADDVVPVDLSTATPATGIGLGSSPNDIAITPDGGQAWITAGSSEGSLTPLVLPADYIGTGTSLPAGPNGLAISTELLPTSTSLAASTKTATVGHPMELSATVRTTPAGDRITGGTLTISAGTTTLCSRAVPAQVAPVVVSCTYTWQSSGLRDLTARYSGPDFIIGSASAPVALNVIGGSGYWEAAADGGIFDYGAPYYGSGVPAADGPVVGIARTPTNHGYWMVTSKGYVVSFGDAVSHGSLAGIRLAAPIVGIAATTDGGGYWLVASDGGVFNFGDAGFHGSAGGARLVRPVVGIAATSDGGGYWLVASDGGVFNYGDAGFHGSAGGAHLVRPVVGIAATSDGGGYWLVASDGGVFNYGDAGFHGSAGGVHLVRPVVGIAATSDNGGYLLVASDGGIFNYGDARFEGSAGGAHLVQPVIGLAAVS